jgi:hypothetical protein
MELEARDKQGEIGSHPIRPDGPLWLSSLDGKEV